MAFKKFDIDKLKVTDGKSFSLSDHDTDYTGEYKDPESAKNRLEEVIKKMSREQEKFYATDSHSILLVFQAMDAAGKDSTIKKVMSGINPQGCQVFSFKAPSTLELDHDFLWRTSHRLPQRGRIGIFNRSYYEEVLVCKVHPEYILGQRIPGYKSIEDIDNKFWKSRYKSIREHEEHICTNGTVVLKFFLYVSKEEQKRRFLDRINNPDKNWKFSFNDLNERKHWNDYMDAYEKAIQETASKDNPWYVIPADHKWFMRTAVSEIVLDTLRSLKLSFPEMSEKERSTLSHAKEELESEEDQASS
jgi:PPK2 family polyphosphate:nucleotide phosphotransferase